MLRKLMISSLAALLLGVSGCAAQPGNDQSANNSVAAATIPTDLTSAAVLGGNASYTTFSPDEWDADSATKIALQTNTASADSAAVQVSGSNVTITAGGVYEITGSLAGSLTVAAPDDAQVVLILNGVEVENGAGPAINVQSADDVAIHLATDSSNSVSDAAQYADDAAANAAIYSVADLTISGSGALQVLGNGNDGITSKDDLVITAGDLQVDAADDGLYGKDALVIEDGSLSVQAGGDALKSEQTDDETKGFVLINGGKITAVAADDGITASSDIAITGGTIDLTTGGGASQAADTSDAKGITAQTIALISGGSLKIDSADDAVHSNGSISITGGEITVASGDDGIHADATAQISAGKVTVTQSVEGLEATNVAISGGEVSLVATDDGINGSGDQSEAEGAGSVGGPGGETDSGETVAISGGTLVVDAEGDGLDSNGSLTISGGHTTVYGPTGNGNGILDANGQLQITGGTLIGLGSAGMAQSPDNTSTQPWITASLDAADAGEQVRVLDESDQQLAEVTTRKPAQLIIYSSPELLESANYQIELGGQPAATAAASIETESATGRGGAPGQGGRPGSGEPPQ